MTAVRPVFSLSYHSTHRDRVRRRSDGRLVRRPIISLSASQAAPRPCTTSTPPACLPARPSLSPTSLIFPPPSIPDLSCNIGSLINTRSPCLMCLVLARRLHTNPPRPPHSSLFPTPLCPHPSLALPLLLALVCSGLAPSEPLTTKRDVGLGAEGARKLTLC